MTASVESNTNKENRPKRAFATHTPKWQKFQPKLMVPSGKAANVVSKQATEIYAYNRQYSHVYSLRLAVLNRRIWKTMAEDSAYKRIDRVLELRENVPSMIVGTLVKEAEDADEPPIQPETECRPSDQLFLEDESGRVALKVENVHQYCTGVVMGVKGKVDKTGTLQVEEMVPPRQAPSPTLSGHTTPSDPSSHAPHLLLVSSLLCGDPNVSSVPREMLISYLQGQFTDDAAKVSRVLLAGAGPSSQDPLQGIKELDVFGLELSRCGIPLDIMPSKDDPTTANWPQRPLHSSLLPNASNIVHRATNPYAAGHGEKLVVATDGVNIYDLQKRVLTESKERLTELQALEQTLEWSHICPTGPDSVPTVPHVDLDPMVLEQKPHLYLCGNAQSFATTKTEDGTTLLCVPKFSETGEAVLVNLETMAVELLRFEDNES